MARYRRSSVFDDLLDLVALMPWWAGVGLAIISYFVLHAVAAPSATPPTLQPGQLGQFVAGMLGKSLAYYGQYLLPLICLGGAAMSAWRKKQRKSLTNNVAQSRTTDALDGVTWREFEILVGEAFRRNGFQVMETGGKGADGGVDLVLRKNNEKFFVQCKQWKAYKVGVEVVRELYGVMAAHGAAGGFVVTSGRFTDAATEFAQGRNLKLIDGPMLLKLIQHAKISHSASAQAAPTSTSGGGRPNNAVPPACPHCGNGMVQRSAKRGAHAGRSFWGCISYPACKGIRPMAG
jgi:restriction system protein